jgi:hypothetical protein
MENGYIPTSTVNNLLQDWENDCRMLSIFWEGGRRLQQNTPDQRTWTAAVIFVK